MEEQVWARHILVADEAAAQDVLTRLANGENFAVLAAELSTDTGSAQLGGDLGWFGSGKMVAEFEDAAFSLGIGETSGPVASTHGYHIIQVLGHEERPMADADYEQKQSLAFEDWLAAQRVAGDVEIFDYWLERVPTSPELATSANY
jgi:foldase protein PrsA